MVEAIDAPGVITGASGFIGRSVLRNLPASASVHAVYSGDDGFLAFAKRCAANVQPVRVDLRTACLADHIPDVEWALLAAARVQVAQSWKDPGSEVRDAASVTLNSIRGLRVKRIVHVSSGAVYENLSGTLSPARVLAPRVPYGIAKIVAERVLDAFAEAPWLNLRFFGAFGPGEPAQKLIRRSVEAFVNGSDAFDIVGDGTNRLDPMHVDDAAAALIAALRHDELSRTVDLCQGESRPVDEFLRLAYAAAHDQGPQGGQELQVRHSGATHESVLGSPDASDADALFAVPRRSTYEGLAQYARALRVGTR